METIIEIAMTSRTKIISKSISWSTCMNFWSHSSISVVLRRESSSSAELGGSFRWWAHHSRTLLKTFSETWFEKLDQSLIYVVFWKEWPTLGMGMGSVGSPRSSSMFLMRRERSATSRADRLLAPRHDSDAWEGRRSGITYGLRCSCHRCWS